MSHMDTVSLVSSLKEEEEKEERAGLMNPRRYLETQLSLLHKPVRLRGECSDGPGQDSH